MQGFSSKFQRYRHQIFAAAVMTILPYSRCGEKEIIKWRIDELSRSLPVAFDNPDIISRSSLDDLATIFETFGVI